MFVSSEEILRDFLSNLDILSGLMPEASTEIGEVADAAMEFVQIRDTLIERIKNYNEKRVEVLRLRVERNGYVWCHPGQHFVLKDESQLMYQSRGRGPEMVCEISQVCNSCYPGIMKDSSVVAWSVQDERADLSGRIFFHQDFPKYITPEIAKRWQLGDEMSPEFEL